MLNDCDFIQVYAFTTNHHLNKHILCDDGSAACSGIDALMQKTWSIKLCPI